MREDIFEGLLKDGNFLALLHRNVEFFKARCVDQVFFGPLVGPFAIARPVVYCAR